MSLIKYNRTKSLSKIGDNHASFAAMWAYIPENVIATLAAKHLAAIVDALWQCAGSSKRIGEQEAIENGFVWDHKRNLARDIVETKTAHH